MCDGNGSVSFFAFLAGTGLVGSTAALPVSVRLSLARRPQNVAFLDLHFGLRNGRIAWKGREVGLKAGADHLRKVSNGGRSITTQLNKAFHHSTGRGCLCPFQSSTVLLASCLQVYPFQSSTVLLASCLQV